MNERRKVIRIREKRSEIADVERGMIIDELILVSLYAECRMNAICG
jgi:hypothetical protein